MSATNDLLNLDPCKSVVPFGDGTNHQFHHSDTEARGFGQPSGISCEEGEFLYGLIRILKPLRVLETGTNIGVSASYICNALQDNGVGHLTTIEHSRTVAAYADEKLSRMRFKNYSVFIGEIEEFPQPDFETLDFLWLDSELPQRYAELERFYPCMKVGAIACIHDHPRFGIDEFGEIPEMIKNLMQDGYLNSIEFPTMHGVTIFQKK